MKKIVFGVSVLTMSSVLMADEIGIIEVESTTLSDVSGEEVKSADLADALTRKLPSISVGVDCVSASKNKSVIRRIIAKSCFTSRVDRVACR